MSINREVTGYKPFIHAGIGSLAALTAAATALLVKDKIPSVEVLQRNSQAMINTLTDLHTWRDVPKYLSQRIQHEQNQRNLEGIGLDLKQEADINRQRIELNNALLDWILTQKGKSFLKELHINDPILDSLTNTTDFKKAKTEFLFRSESRNAFLLSCMNLQERLELLTRDRKKLKEIIEANKELLKFSRDFNPLNQEALHTQVLSPRIKNLAKNQIQNAIESFITETNLLRGYLLQL